MFKSFAKLRVSDKSNHKPSIPDRKSSQGNKKDLALATPKCIVRALHSYTAQHNDELTFTKNDFFYVSDEPIKDWYLASNPLTGVKGIVPKSYFEVIQRQDSQSVPVSQALQERAKSIASMEDMNHQKTKSGSNANANANANSRSSSGRPTLYMYGFVLYDFQAERTDELTVNGGESVVITAQSNEEWFVAKPIGRLGGPGLVPVSYIELREVGTDEPLTDVSDAIKRAQIPQVDEWKRRLAEYKAGSLSLGRHQRAPSSTSHQHSRTRSQVSSSAASQASRRSNTPGTPAFERLSSHSGHSGHHSMKSPPPTPSKSSFQVPYVISATVERFDVDGLRYWYLVRVELSNGRFRNLCRFYQDFYDFQIKLLEQFPEEAGRTGKQRLLPFMPGPLSSVQADSDSSRKANLDEYVKELLNMPQNISRSSVLLDLFDLKKGDVESNGPSELMPELIPGASVGYSGDIPDPESKQDVFGEDVLSPPSISVPSPPASTSASEPSIQESSKGLSTPEVHAEGDSHNSIKVKVYRGEKVIAFKVPAETSFASISEKIDARLESKDVEFFADKSLTEKVDNAAAFARLLNGGNKLALYVV